MPSPILCAKFISLFIPRGRLLFNIAQCRQSLRTLVITSGVTSAKTQDPPLSNQTNAIIKRQIQIKTSNARTRTQSPHNVWDKISEDYTLVYQFGLKNWIWGYYAAQPVYVAFSCWFFGHEIFKQIEVLPPGYLEFIIVSYCVLTSVLSLGNFWFRKMFIRIYYNKQTGKFVGVRRTCFGRLEKIYYSPDDVILSGKRQKNIDVSSVVTVLGRKYYLAAANFVSPKYYNMHMGSQEFADSQQNYVRGGPKF